MSASARVAIVILILGYWIAGRISRLIVGMGDRYEKLDSTLFTFLGSIARYVVLAFTFIAVLNRFGVETTSIVALLGAAGLAIGLALQGAMTNLAAGVMLMIFRPYKVGDFAEVGVGCRQLEQARHRELGDRAAAEVGVRRALDVTATNAVRLLLDRLDPSSD